MSLPSALEDLINKTQPWLLPELPSQVADKVDTFKVVRDPPMPPAYKYIYANYEEGS